MKDCTTCKYGYEDEQLGIPMCHHPKRFSEDCVDFNKHEEKEIKESEKSIIQKGSDVTDFCKPIDPGIAQCIADHSWEMLGEDEKSVPNDLEEAAEEYLDIVFGKGKHHPFYKELFIAGAKWDRQQMMKIITKDDNLEEAGIQYVKTHFRDIDWTPDVIKLCLEEAFISGGEYVFKKIKYE